MRTKNAAAIILKATTLEALSLHFGCIVFFIYLDILRVLSDIRDVILLDLIAFSTGNA